MLEITVIAIFLLVFFIAVAWYAKYRSEKAREALLLDDEPYREIDGDDEFAVLLDKEIQQQGLNQSSDINDEPQVTLSVNGAETTDVDTPKIVIDETAVEPKAEQQTLDFTDTAVQQDWEMSLAFTVMAKPERYFNGLDIQPVLEQLDMQFGEMQLFHRYLTAAGQRQVLFSVANVVEPGILSPDEFDILQTPGLLIFAHLPGPLNGLLLFDEILDAANQLAEVLDGVICNEQRQEMGQSDIEAIRSKILNFNMALQAESDF